MRQIHTVTNGDGSFDPALGAISSTCRLGRKYLDLEVDETVELTAGPDLLQRTVFGIAEIQRLEFLEFDRLEERHIATNASREARMCYDHLRQTMVTAYGNAFNEFSHVTVVFYRRVE